MISSDTRTFSFPNRGQLNALLGVRPGAPAGDALALGRAIERGYTEGLAEGRRAAEEEARKLAETSRREGFEAGRGEAFVQVEQAAQALREALAGFERVRAEMLSQAESLCVDLALAIVSRLVESDPIRGKFVSRVVSKALEVLAPEPPQAIYLHPADRALLGDEHKGLPFKDDPTLARGQSRVEAGRLVVEGGIDHAFEQIKSAALEVKERRTQGSKPK